MSVEAFTPQHPILRAIDRMEEALDLAGGSDPAYLPVQAQREAMVALTGLVDRLLSLQARVVHAADAPGAAADSDGAPSSASWLAAQTRTGFGAARAAQRLGEAVTERWHRVGTALADGRIRVEQARVIIRALDALPADEVGPEVLALAEERLVELAGEFDPRRLTALGEKILEVVAPDRYDDQEREALERAQRRANAATRLTLARRGDGSTDLKARLPDHVADRLRTMLQAWTSPRHDATAGSVFDQRDPATGARLPQERLFGEAFRAFLEAADPDRLPAHGGGATRILVTIDLEALRTGLGLGEVVTSGDEEVKLTASEVRRLACHAGIIPVVLGGDGETLDLGRSRRLFSPAQRTARMRSQRTCTAQGCTIPATWCEAHHGRDPWAQGGSTDLDDLTLLCSWHHQRAHDPGYRTDRHADGSLRFHRRR